MRRRAGSPDRLHQIRAVLCRDHIAARWIDKIMVAGKEAAQHGEVTRQLVWAAGFKCFFGLFRLQAKRPAARSVLFKVTHGDIAGRKRKSDPGKYQRPETPREDFGVNAS